MVYFYAPEVVDTRPHPIAGRPDMDLKVPGRDDGQGIVSALDSMPRVRIVVVYSDPGVRFVLGLPDGAEGLPGWAAKTSDEVLADYPGVL